MSRTRRSGRWGAALAALAVAATAASLGAAAAQAETTDEEVIFKVGVQQRVDSLNPFTGVTATAYEVWQLMYDPLIGYDENFGPQPLIATDVPKVSDDGLTYTYDIREGVKWSDGEDLTASDVAYTFNRVMTGQVEGVNYGGYVKNIETVKAPNDTTVVMTTAKPSPLMTTLAVPIVPEHIWEQIDEKEVSEFTNEPGTELGAVGSGPFVLTEAQTDQFWTFKSNPDYYLGAPKVAGVSLVRYENPEALKLALVNGEIDFYDDIDAPIYNSLLDTEGVTTRNSVYYGITYVTFNPGAEDVDGNPIGDGHPALADIRVREAIEYAMDKQTLVDRVLDGKGSPGTSFIPPLYTDLHYEPENPRTYDVDMANQILDDAGYTVGDDGIRVMPEDSEDPGLPLEFRLYGRQESQSSQKTVQFMKTWLEEIGIATKVEIVSETFLLDIAATGDFDMYEWGWVVEPDPDYQVSVFTCGQLPYTNANGNLKAALNDSFYCNEDYDQLYAKQATTVDPDARAAIVQEMQKMVFDNVAYIIPFYYDYLQAYDSGFTGFQPQPDPDGPILFQYGTWGYRYAEFAGDSTSGSDSESSNTPVLIGGIALAAVLIGGVVFFVSRGRRRADDTE